MSRGYVEIKTLHLMVDSNDLRSSVSEASLTLAAEILRSGGIVAFPTETVYGLGANALDAAAVARIFEAKRRPSWDPLIVHVSDREMLEHVAIDVPQCAHRLMDVFWPGPLTMLVPRNPKLPSLVTAGRPRVGVRIPAHPVAMELIRRAGVPIAAPSANTFGRPSPTTAAHVFEDLDGRVDAVLDGGETWHGLESTVVDTCEIPAVVYRPGVISLEQIAAVCGLATAFANSLGPVSTPWDAADSLNDKSTDDDGVSVPARSIPAPPSPDEVASMASPGMGLRHYAPHARLVLIDGEGAAQQAAFTQAMAEARQRSERVGLMLPTEFERRSYMRLKADGGLVYRWGTLANAEELAQRLFSGLRALDAAGATIILCPLPKDSGLGVAIRDRLKKASR